MRLSTSCCFLLVSLGLALAVPAHKKIEKKSISNSLAPKAIEPVDQKLDAEPKISDEALMEQPGENVDRAKKQASTTFCVEIRQNKQVPVDCDDINSRPVQPPPAEPPASGPEPHEHAPPSTIHIIPQQPQVITNHLACEPEMAAFMLQPSGEVVIAPTGNCANHAPGLIHVPLSNPTAYNPCPVHSQPLFHIPSGGAPAFPTIQVISIDPLRPTAGGHPLHPGALHGGLHGLHGPYGAHRSGIECTCKTTEPGILRTSSGPDPSNNEALAMKFLQDLQRSAQQQPADAAPAPVMMVSSGSPVQSSTGPSSSGPGVASASPTVVLSTMTGSPAGSQPAETPVSVSPSTVTVTMPSGSAPCSSQSDSDLPGSPRTAGSSPAGGSLPAGPGSPLSSWLVRMPPSSGGSFPAGPGSPLSSWIVGMPPSSGGSFPAGPGSPLSSWAVGMAPSSGSPQSSGQAAWPISARYMVHASQPNMQQQVVYQQQSAINGMNGPPMSGYPSQMYPGGGMGQMMRSKDNCLEDSFQTHPIVQGLRISRDEEGNKDQSEKEQNKKEGPAEEKKLNPESVGQKDDKEKGRIARFLMPEKNIASNKLDDN